MTFAVARGALNSAHCSRCRSRHCRASSIAMASSRAPNPRPSSASTHRLLASQAISRQHLSVRPASLPARRSARTALARSCCSTPARRSCARSMVCSQPLPCSIPVAFAITHSRVQSSSPVLPCNGCATASASSKNQHRSNHSLHQFLIPPASCSCPPSPAWAHPIGIHRHADSSSGSLAALPRGILLARP